MRNANRETWQMDLEEWESALLRSLKWTDRDLQLLQEGSEVLFRLAEVVLNDDSPIPDKTHWFRRGWEAGRASLQER